MNHARKKKLEREQYGWSREYIKETGQRCRITGVKGNAAWPIDPSHIDKTKGAGAKDDLILPMVRRVHKIYETCMKNEARWLKHFPDWPFERLRNEAVRFKKEWTAWAIRTGKMEGDDGGQEHLF